MLYVMAARKPTIVVDFVGTLEDDWLVKREWLAARGCALPIQLSRTDIENEAGRQLLQYLQRDFRVASLAYPHDWLAVRGWLIARGVDIGSAPLAPEETIRAVGYQLYVQMKKAVADPAVILRNPPIPGAADALRRLHERFWIVLLSTLRTDQGAVVRQWLDANMPHVVDAIVLTGDESGGPGRSKIDWCLVQPVVPFALIDDDARHLPDRGTDVRCFLLNVNGRREKTPGGAREATSWGQIADALIAEVSETSA